MKKNSSTSTGKKFIQNSGWMMFSRIYQMLVSLIVGALTARYLGPSNYGVLNYGLAYVNIFNVICSLGFEGILVKNIINNPKNEGKTVGTSLFLRLIITIISIISLLLFFSVSLNDQITKIVAIIQTFSLLFNLHETLELWFQSKLMSKYSTIAKCIAYTVVGAWKIILLVLKVNVKFFAFSTVIESFVMLLVLLISYIKLKGPKMEFVKDMSKPMLVGGSQFLLSSLCIIVYTRMDKIMLGYYIDNNAVGIYTAAIVISELWQFIPMAFINSSRPLLLEYKKNNDEKNYIEKTKLVYSFTIYLGLFVGIAMLIFGKLAIKILYGIEYIEAYKPLVILIWSSIFAVIGSVRATWLITESKEKYLKYYVFIGAIINLILNYLLIKKYEIIGVAIATLIAQFVVSVFAPFVFKETRESVSHLIKSVNPKLLINFIKKFKEKYN